MHGTSACSNGLGLPPNLGGGYALDERLVRVGQLRGYRSLPSPGHGKRREQQRRSLCLRLQADVGLAGESLAQQAPIGPGKRDISPENEQTSKLNKP